MKDISCRYILMLICLLTISFIIGCRSSNSVAISDSKHVYIVVGEIKLEEPVYMFIEIKNELLSLITTKTNAIRYSRNEIDLNGLMRLENVYLNGENPFVLDDKHFQKYPNLGMDAVGSREILSDVVEINHLTTNCFLLAFLDHETYRQTQLRIGVSYFFQSKFDWVFLKFAFTMACPDN